MKKIFTIILFTAINLSAQNFTVEKISGKVQVLHGTSEKFVEVKAGEKLNGNDLVITDEKSYIQLIKDGNIPRRIILQSNSALGLNYVKEISINDLLLALAQEEIRRIPKNNGNGNTKNTAVYGEEIKAAASLNISEDLMGIKRINGAKQLAENGYKESAVIVAKETFRKYPSAKNKINDRIYFADLLVDLKLYSEAFEEFSEIRKESPGNEIINEKLEVLKSKIEN